MNKLECPTEHQECVVFVKGAHYQSKIGDLDLLHIPNEAKRHAGGWIKLKQIGLIKGASDYFLAIPTKHYHGLFIEMKRREKSKSKVSVEQKRFIERQIEKGYYGKACYGAGEALDLVARYLSDEIFY